MTDKLPQWWKLPMILSLTSLTALVVLNFKANTHIDTVALYTQHYKYTTNNTNNDIQILFPWQDNLSQRYQMYRSNNINITSTWQCCGFGHRFHYHATVYEHAVRHGKALLIFWPTRNKCYSNIIGNNYTINDLFPELFDCKQINKGFNGNNTNIHPGDILSLNPSYILPSIDPNTAQRQPQLNQQLINDNIADSVIIGSEKMFSESMHMHNIYYRRRTTIQVNKPGGIGKGYNKYEKHFYLALIEHLNQKVLNPIETFVKEKHLLSKDTNLITIHIRQGNAEKGHFRYSHRRNKIYPLAYAVNEQIEYLTEKSKQNNWKIFVASDSGNIINKLREICKYEIITRNQIRPKRGVWFGQMGDDMPKNCLDTSIDSLVDMMLLTLGDIFLFPVGSTFNRLPQVVVAERDGIVCGIVENTTSNVQEWKCQKNDNMLTQDELNIALNHL